MHIHIHIQGTHFGSAVCDGCAFVLLDYVRTMCADHVRLFVLIMYGSCAGLVCMYGGVASSLPYQFKPEFSQVQSSPISVP